jgi:predicted nucleotidyltransferase
MVNAGGAKSKMRIKPYEIKAIKSGFEKVFLDGRVFLFGSRADDCKKGGDIDLFIETNDKTDLFEKKIKFLAQIKKAIGEQKIDVVFDEDSDRLIEKEARRWAIPL